MVRKNDSPQKAAMREMMRDYLKNNDISIKNGTDVNAVMRDMMSVLLEGALDEELDEELGYSKYDYRNKDTENSRNGHSQKTMHTSYGDMEIAIPRDRNGEYEPQLIKKYQNTITQDMEEKILSMYAKGMTTRQISDTIEDIYGFEVSEGMISDITDKLLPRIEEWQNRPLAAVYPIVFIDAVHFSVRDDGVIRKLAAYVVLGINEEGKKEVLTIVIGENESSKYWLSVLNSLKNRGVRDILILCSDGLTGIKEAITAAFPMTEQQRCIVHMVRNTLKYVANKDMKAFAKELKTIYTAPDEKAALSQLDMVSEKWETHYPGVLNRWRENWDAISPIFKFSKETRTAFYTTNAIESLNSSYRRLNKQRSVFPSSQSLLKSLYLSTFEVAKKWTMPIRNWGKVRAELVIMYPERMPE